MMIHLVSSIMRFNVIYTRLNCCAVDCRVPRFLSWNQILTNFVLSVVIKYLEYCTCFNSSVMFSYVCFIRAAWVTGITEPLKGHVGEIFYVVRTTY